jgi:NTP pyrophosphatase (non-canonical NTP hydrolase)
MQSFDEYQEAAHSTSLVGGAAHNIINKREPSEIFFLLRLHYASLKLNGEAGEVAEVVGKGMRDDYGLFTIERTAMLEKELGDVLWYVAEICTIMGWSMEELAEKNIRKLAKRQEEGKLHGDGSDR